MMMSVINNNPLEEIIKKISRFVDEVRGEVVFAFKKGREFQFYDRDGKNIEETSEIKDSKTFKKVIKTNEKYYGNKSDGFYLGIPLFHKNDLLGVILIKEKQRKEIEEKMNLIVNYLILVYYFNELKEVENNHTIKDFATKLYNERHFRFQLELEEEKRRRYNDDTKLTLLIISHANFNEISKKYNYDTAERSLRHLAQIILKQSRKTDMPARISENEIGILMPHTDVRGAETLFARINNSVKKPIKINKAKINIRLKCASGTMELNETKEEFLNKVRKRI